MHKECTVCGAKNHFHPFTSDATAPTNQTVSRQQVSQIIDLLRKLKIKVIAFDFDQTIVNVHTHGQWRDSAGKLAKFVRLYLRELIVELAKCTDISTCIVTYSSQTELIREVLRISLQEYNVYVEFFF